MVHDLSVQNRTDISAAMLLTLLATHRKSALVRFSK